MAPPSPGEWSQEGQQRAGRDGYAGPVIPDDVFTTVPDKMNWDGEWVDSILMGILATDPRGV